MGQTFLKDQKKTFSQLGGDTTALDARVTTLEDENQKVTYFYSIAAGTTGTITIPTGATIILDELYSGTDAYLNAITNGQPTGKNPFTAGGVTVDVTSFDALGNYTINGTPSVYPVALIYQLRIKEKNLGNLTEANIIDLEDNQAMPYLTGTTGTYLRFAGAGISPIVSTLVLPNAATINNLAYASAANTIGLTSNVLVNPSGAYIQFAAGDTNNVPIQLTSGTLKGSAVAGGIEFNSDKYYGTITTGAVRKEFTINDTTLTSTRIPIATTNGRLTDNASLTFSSSTLMVGVTNQFRLQGDVSSNPNDILAACSLTSIGSMNIFEAGGTNGKVIAMLHYNGSVYNSVVEFANTTASATPGLLLCKRGGKVGIGLGAGVSPTFTTEMLCETLGSGVIKYSSPATNDDPTVSIYQNRVATTDATLTTLHTQAITASNSTVLSGYVVARRTGGSAGTAEDGAAYFFDAVYKNTAGTAALIGGGVTVIGESQAGWDCQLNVSAGNVLIQVIGATNNNVVFHLSKLEVMAVGT